MAKIKKTKSHGKPTINKKSYNESAKTIGIDIEAYGPRKPRPIMVYKIYCHYKKILDHSKYPWAKQYKYSESSYKYKMDSDNVCNRLELQYPNWYFFSVSEFVDPNTPITTNINTVDNIIYDIPLRELELQERLKTTNKNITDNHKKMILKEVGIDGEEGQPQTTKKKTKKSKKI